MEKKNSGVEAVDKALQILNAFSEKREELTLTEIAKQINQYKSTTSRLCTSLLKFGYLAYDILSLLSNLLHNSSHI